MEELVCLFRTRGCWPVTIPLARNGVTFLFFFCFFFFRSDGKGGSAVVCAVGPMGGEDLRLFVSQVRWGGLAAHGEEQKLRLYYYVHLRYYHLDRALLHMRAPADSWTSFGWVAPSAVAPLALPSPWGEVGKDLLVRSGRLGSSGGFLSLHRMDCPKVRHGSNPCRTRDHSQIIIRAA